MSINYVPLTLVFNKIQFFSTVNEPFLGSIIDGVHLKIKKSLKNIEDEKRQKNRYFRNIANERLKFVDGVVVDSSILHNSCFVNIVSRFSIQHFIQIKL